MTKWICKCCEAENEETADYCIICGAKRALSAETKPVMSAEKTILYCDENGNPVDSPEKAASFRMQGFDEYGNRYERWGYMTADGRRPDTVNTAPVIPHRRGSAAKSDLPDRTKAKPDAAVSGEELRDSIRKADQKKRIFRLLIVGLVIVQYILFLQPYSMLIKGNMVGLYAIYYNAIGENGTIEQICSLILVLITVLPAVLCWIHFKPRSRNLPVTVCAFVSGLSTIYCAVIWFGSEMATIVPALIILSSWLVFLFTVLLVKASSRQSEVITRPKGF